MAAREKIRAPNLASCVRQLWREHDELGAIPSNELECAPVAGEQDPVSLQIRSRGPKPLELRDLRLNCVDCAAERLLVQCVEGVRLPLLRGADPVCLHAKLPGRKSAGPAAACGERDGQQDRQDAENHASERIRMVLFPS